VSEAVPLKQERNAGRISRRQVLACAGCAALGGVSGWLLRGQPRSRIPPDSAPENAEHALARLREGNQRFVDGQLRHGHESRNWRHALVADQRPFAVVLGCSDSRVPIELIFDQGFGDLFVIRVAGNVISTWSAASRTPSPICTRGCWSCWGMTIVAPSPRRWKQLRLPQSLSTSRNWCD
jgi:hypothetical protein